MGYYFFTTFQQKYKYFCWEVFILGKKVRKYKNVEIVLEPDGFSIHTIEFSRKVFQTEWRQIKSALYDYNEQYSENIIHPDGLYHGCHICTQYAEAGIRIRLQRCTKGT